MEKWRHALLAALIAAGSIVVLGNSGSTDTIELHYKIVLLELDFQVRLYSELTWMSARIDDLSYEKATLSGYARLLEYMQGGNLNSSWLLPTVPIITTLIPGAGPLHSSAYSVRLYLPPKFQAKPPTPLPDLDLKLYKWPIRCVAVRKFFGYATDESVVKEVEGLSKSLSKSLSLGNITASDDGYSVAQYSSPFQIPFQITGGINEVWVDVTVDGIDYCRSSGPAVASAY